MEKEKATDSNNGYDKNGKLFSEFSTPTYDEWKEAVVKLLKGKPFDKAMYTKTPKALL